MTIKDRVKARLEVLKVLTPRGLKRLGNSRLSDLVLKELGQARKRVDELQRRYPTASPREIAQHLIDARKGMASVVGGVSGVFGVASVPADLLVMAWLELLLLVDVATVYKVNLKADRSRKELLDLFGYASGVGPIRRAGPKVLGKVMGRLLEEGGLKVLGRAVPLLAAPISAYLNNQNIQKVGEDAIRHYEGFERAEKKSRKIAEE